MSFLNRIGAAVTGDDAYQFGDLSKGAATKAGGAIEGVVHAAGGDPEYRFGDGTRAVIGGVGRATETAAQALGADGYQFGDVSQAIAGGLSEAAGASRSFIAAFLADAADAGKQPVELVGLDAEERVARIWSVFFGQCYADALAALQSGELPPEAVLDREVFFFIGLPARTLLGTCLRSLEAGAAEDIFVLASGLRVRQKHVPPELAPLFSALRQIKADIGACQLSEADRDVLMFEALFGGTERPPPRASTVEQQERCHSLAGALTALATQVTQLAFYKQNFSEILEQLDAVATEMEAAGLKEELQTWAEPEPDPEHGSGRAAAGGD